MVNQVETGLVRSSGWCTVLATLHALERLENPAPTFTDNALVGNTAYFYRVDVATRRDELLVGTEQSGRFHEVVGVWPLPVGIDPSPPELPARTDHATLVQCQPSRRRHDGGLCPPRPILTAATPCSRPTAPQAA